MHWAARIATQEVEEDRGPVLVTVEYEIDPRNREPFLLALRLFAWERAAMGAYDWAPYEDPARDAILSRHSRRTPSFSICARMNA